MVVRCRTAGASFGLSLDRLSPRKMLRRQVGVFARDEDGALILFSLMLFLLMCMMGGVAVDLMRFEQQRTEMQQTLDRSVLAAASMSQALNPQDVVEDYFAKAGLEQYLDDVQAPPGLNTRRVTAEASADVPTFLMHLIGIDNLEAFAGSSAEQSITNVEVSLVLDISRSMVLFPDGTNNPQKFRNMKDAAQEFVDTVLGDQGSDRISISLVPYNGQVNLGEELYDQFAASYEHNYPESHCLDLPTSVYSTHSLSTTTARPQSGFFDSFSHGGQTAWFWNGWNWVQSENNTWTEPQPFTTNASGFLNVWCQPNLTNIVRPLQNDPALLDTYIEDLVAIGATSIDLGVKWALTLLSPNTNSVVQNLSTAGIVPNVFSNRPLSFTANDSMKVIVLMTDGEHFAEERLNNNYRTSQPLIYRSNGDGRLSIRHTVNGNTRFWVPHLSAWQNTVYNSGSGTTRLRWNQIWEDYRMQWIAWQLYARPLGTSASNRATVFNTWMNNFRTQVPTTEMDNRLQNICNVAKNNNVIIYGVAFEAPTNGVQQIRDCSTSDSHFFDVSGLQIRTAFRSIASNISQLKLTQ